MHNTFPQFTRKCVSLLKKHLTQKCFQRLGQLKTQNGFTLSDAIHSGVVNQDSSIGVYAGDHESYSLFSELYDPIICDYHDVPQSMMHIADLTPIDTPFENPDPEGNNIVSTRIRVGRNLDGFPLGTCISREDRFRVESLVSSALKTLTGDLSGTYYSLSKMDATLSRKLTESHYLFKSGDRFLEAAGLNRHWPEGRGIFLNPSKTFLVWVNEEDQLRIISMELGGNIHGVYNRLVNAVNQLETRLGFILDNRLGYVTSCPTNLGTAMRASVHIRLPGLSRQPSILKELAEDLNLQIRGIHGEHSESEGGVFDISNKRRLGITEKQCITDLSSGIKEIIRSETST